MIFHHLTKARPICGYGSLGGGFPDYFVSSVPFCGYRSLILVIVLIASAWPNDRATAQNQTLSVLRADFAMRYLEPEPHLALAKYFLEHGNRLQAFTILEVARRSRFEQPVFNHAFQLVFRGFDNSPAQEGSLLKSLERDPRNTETLFKLSDIYISRDDWTRALKYLHIAVALKPDDFKFTAGLIGVLQAQGRSQEAHELVLEYTRKYPDSEESFRFRAEQLDKKDPAKAKSILLAGTAKFPGSGDLWFALGRVLQNENHLDAAEQAFVKAAASAPDSPDVQAWVGRFFYRVRENKARALDYYLSAYFLDPDAYESEYVESRVRSLSTELAEAEIVRRSGAGIALTDMLGDPNPVIVALALEQIADHWHPADLGPVLKAMSHDDTGVRWQAMTILKKYADPAFDQQLKDLLKDSDQRKRGLAAYLAVHRWQAESFPAIKLLLLEDTQLLRFDAISALMLEGGQEGRRIALEHAAHERNPTLKKMIESQGKEVGRKP